MKFYAVKVGKVPGIYHTWDECKKQVHKFSGAIFKSFESKKEAEVFMVKNKKKRKRSVFEVGVELKQTKTKKRKMKNKKVIKIYTDGGCRGNGTMRAVAGIGVYFGKDDKRNVSKKIDGIGTNNRGELSAILEALRIVKNNTEMVEIMTDSTYCINGINGDHKIKKNSDIFDLIFKVLNERKGKTRFIKVLAHTGLKDGNHFADSLATLAIS